MAFNPGLSIGQILKSADIVGKKVGEKKMGYEVCMKNKLLQFI